MLVVRETPLGAAHLRDMLAVTEAGGVVMPPVAFYLRPESLEDVIGAGAWTVLAGGGEIAMG
jgi:4-hydroxy-3-polyprenylbenzoate decarboxylase